MASDVEIERALATITATLNDHRVEKLDPRDIQRLVDESIGAPHALTVDAGGGIHERSGARIGAVRRTSSGRWIGERQNAAAEHSEAAIPAGGKRPGPLRRLWAKLSP
jgi:hypothetical protein